MIGNMLRSGTSILETKASLLFGFVGGIFASATASMGAQGPVRILEYILYAGESVYWTVGETIIVMGGSASLIIAAVNLTSKITSWRSKKHK